MPATAASDRDGAEPLTPEDSRSASLGLVWASGAWQTTLDAYRIEVSDRIARSTDFTVTDADRAALLAAGIDAGSISRVASSSTTSTPPPPAWTW